MKILILVLSFDDGGIYKEFYNTQRTTWDSEDIQGVHTFYFFGNSDECKIDGNNIHVDVPENLYNCGYKTLKAFDLIKSFDFDFIFRTNSSSYVDKKLLYNFVKDKPNENYCSAAIGIYHSIPFPSGCGYFLSKDLVELVLNQKHMWNHNFIDDVSLGKILLDNNIKILPSLRHDVTPHQFIPPNFFHYRLCNNDRNFDLETMYRIKKIKDEFYKI